MDKRIFDMYVRLSVDHTNVNTPRQSHFEVTGTPQQFGEYLSIPGGTRERCRSLADHSGGCVPPID
jgi:hypothetical protein